MVRMSPKKASLVAVGRIIEENGNRSFFLQVLIVIAVG